MSFDRRLAYVYPTRRGDVKTTHMRDMARSAAGDFAKSVSVTRPHVSVGTFLIHVDPVAADKVERKLREEGFIIRGQGWGEYEKHRLYRFVVDFPRDSRLGQQYEVARSFHK